MEIENNNKVITTIDKLNIGDCFVYDDRLHMRICNNDYVQPDSYFQYMVIDLVKNKINVFVDNAVVYKIDAKIIIK